MPLVLTPNPVGDPKGWPRGAGTHDIRTRAPEVPGTIVGNPREPSEHDDPVTSRRTGVLRVFLRGSREELEFAAAGCWRAGERPKEISS